MAQWAVFAEVEAGTRFFASGSRGVSGTQSINNDFQLSYFVSGVRIEVLGTVNCAYNPKHIYTYLEPALVKAWFTTWQTCSFGTQTELLWKAFSHDESIDFHSHMFTAVYSQVLNSSE